MLSCILSVSVAAILFLHPGWPHTPIELQPASSLSPRSLSRFDPPFAGPFFFFFLVWSPCPPQQYSYRRHLTALFQAYTVYRNHSTLPFQFRPVGCCGVPKRKAIAPFILHRKVEGRKGLKGPEMEEGLFGYLHRRDPC